MSFSPLCLDTPSYSCHLACPDHLCEMASHYPSPYLSKDHQPGSKECMGPGAQSRGHSKCYLSCYLISEAWLEREGEGGTDRGRRKRDGEQRWISAPPGFLVQTEILFSSRFLDCSHSCAVSGFPIPPAVRERRLQSWSSSGRAGHPEKSVRACFWKLLVFPTQDARFSCSIS